MLASTLWWRDAIVVVLTGFVVANTFHALNHLLDLSLGGGHGYDWWVLGLFSVFAGAALVARVRVLRDRVTYARS